MLYERYNRLMMSVCLRYCKDEFMAQEALQNGFIKMFNSLHCYNPALPFGPWIRRIMINCSLDQLSKKTDTVDIDEVNYTGNAVYNQMDAELTGAELMRLVDTMPAGYRAVFNMYVIDDMSHQEIAEILQITEATSRSQLFKARNYLKNALTKQQKMYL